MSLEILLVLVVGGVGGIVLLTHLLGGSRLEALDVYRARLAFAAEHPTVPVERVRVDAKGEIAVLWTTDGRVGVVKRLGQHTAVRIVDADHVATDEDGARVRIRFADLGWPPLDVQLADPGPPDA